MATETLTEVVTYQIDPAHSRLSFVARHMGFSKVRGSFEKFEGTIRMVPEELSTIEAEATIQANSLTTNEEKRDEHLRSADFFLIDEYPTITFKSKQVRDVSGNGFTLIGDFTLRGVTKTLELKSEYLGSGVDPWGQTRIAFDAETRINRNDYGLSWNAVLEAGGFLVGDDVELVLEIQAIQQ